MTREEKYIGSRISRRGFMGATTAASLAALVGREPQLVRAAESIPAPTCDSIIVLWMAGGMAQTETWDPKKYTPFSPGVKTSEVLSTSIPPSITSRSRRGWSESRRSWIAAR